MILHAFRHSRLAKSRRCSLTPICRDTTLRGQLMKDFTAGTAAPYSGRSPSWQLPRCRASHGWLYTISCMNACAWRLWTKLKEIPHTMVRTSLT